jgi:hypothetical protein
MSSKNPLVVAVLTAVLIVAALIGYTVHVSNETALKKIAAIQAMVAAGASPVEARCAFNNNYLQECALATALVRATGDTTAASRVPIPVPQP